jgi:hypothetical protein
MSWARDEVLFRAQFGLFGMKAVQNRVFREQPDRSTESTQQATLDLVRSLVGEGLAILGDRTERGFVPWPDPAERLDDLQGHIADAADPPWLRLTDAGRQAAQAVPVDDGGGETPDSAVKQWDWPLPHAARELLIYGTVDWIELGQIHWRVSEVSPGEPVTVLQQRTLELIADFVRGGLAQIGAFSAEALGFVPWECSLDDALNRVRSVYVDDHGDSSAWEWFCMLELTRRGELLARSIEAGAKPGS